MNRIVLIGNGFDLAHGLKTRYEDFINWYWDQRLHNIVLEHNAVSADVLCRMKILPQSGFENWYLLSYNNSFFKNLLKNEWKLSGQEFVKEIENNPDCFEITYSPFLENICKGIETKGWVDIENEYYALLAQQTSPIIGIGNIQRLDSKILNFQLDYLKSLLIEYLKIEDKKEVETIRSIQDKIYKPIKRREMAVANLNSGNQESKNFMPTNIMLLNFNYTKTAKRYVDSGSIVQINHIHGYLDNAESVIFGYGDELDSDYEKLKNLNDNECLRNMKSIRYLEANNYRRMLEFIESSPFQVCIMGHSCGNSDRTLLNTLFEHKNCISIKPYYYVKEDGTDNYLELVQNISRNFTDMKLMRDRVANKMYCEPLT